MTRLVKRHMGGGWMAAIDTFGKIGSSVGDLIRQREHDKNQREIAAMNMQQAQAERETAKWRAKAAAATQFDKGEGSVSLAIDNGMRTIPYNNSLITPGYQMAAMPQANPSVFNSGILSGTISSSFNKGNNNDSDEGETEVHAGTRYEDMSPDQKRQVQAEWREQERARQELEGEIQVTGEEKPAITGETPASQPTSAPAASTNSSKMDAGAEDAKKKEKVKVTSSSGGSSSGSTASAKDGCKLKKRFNPREFKKKK